MKKILLIPVLSFSVIAFAQQVVTGHVVDASLAPLAHVSVAVPQLNTIVYTDKLGNFSFASKEGKVNLIISKQGYDKLNMVVELPQQSPLQVQLERQSTEIEEVSVSTGYQKIPKERATGSFSVISADVLNQQVGTNILSRLEAVGNAISVDRGTTGDGPQLMLRGISTIKGPKSPLIIVDNFPYEGDINNINPNIVESISLLKDASATSIWGARAANGVIVIKTKTGKYNQAVNVELVTSLTMAPKPDLNYLRNISSSDFIDVEEALFKKGFYNSDITSSNHPVLSPVVDLLNKEKKGLISHDEVERQLAVLRRVDVRGDYKKYMYRSLENRQYAMNIGGGTARFSWLTTLGYDDNSNALEARYKRANIGIQNTWKATDRLTLTTKLYYTDARTASGRSPYGSIAMKNGNAVPYMRMADDAGHALVVATGYDQNAKDSYLNKGLVDWNYYPLIDWQNNQQKANSNELIVNGGLEYQILKGLSADLKYQYQRQNSVEDYLHTEQSYYARNFVNTFAQLGAGGVVNFIVPKGGILDHSNILSEVHNLRGQLNYNGKWGRHSISALGGAESRASSILSAGSRYYGYNQYNLSTAAVDYTKQYPMLMNGNNSTIERNESLGERHTRFVSLFANMAYTFDGKYTLSGSMRRDASNLFGLKTNDQWNPFWSVGASWALSKEAFMDFRGVPYLRLRVSYGYNGNIDPSMVAATTISYMSGNSYFTNFPMARVSNYYNPKLRWETSRMINVGLDFGTQNKRISGSVEYFTKRGSNLFGPENLDYTTGISNMTANVADTKGHGIDIALQSVNIQSSFLWTSTLNFSTYKDKVLGYNLASQTAQYYIGNGYSIPIAGLINYPVYSIFAYRWAGLDPETGDPRGYLNGEVSKNYTSMIGRGTPVQDMQYFGSALPTYYGSFINSWSYKNFSLDVGISYKFGYWFRRSSISYTDLFTNWKGHSDYADRWQKPGDELSTDVPSNLYVSNNNRDIFYRGASVLVEKGDHIRLQYINIGYDLRNESQVAGRKIFDKMHLFVNMSNLGLLWAANKRGIDPDYNIGQNNLKPTMNVTLGLRVKF